VTELTLVASKLDRLAQALREAFEMDRRQLDLRAAQPSIYDRGLHVAAMAQTAQSIYTRLEELLKDILTLTDGGVPTTPSWHRDLLLLAATPVAGVRPALIDSAAQAVLAELLGFRHVVRGAYATELREPVRRNVELMFRELPAILSSVRSTCERYFGGSETSAGD
jgi:hypothetical protein